MSFTSCTPMGAMLFASYAALSTGRRDHGYRRQENCAWHYRGGPHAARGSLAVLTGPLVAAEGWARGVPGHPRPDQDSEASAQLSRWLAGRAGSPLILS